MADDLRQRYADAIARWALMYPIPAWSLSEGERAEKLARNWGSVAAEAVLAVRDDARAEALRRAEHAEAERERVYGLMQATIERNQELLVGAIHTAAAVARVRGLIAKWAQLPGTTYTEVAETLLAALDVPADGEQTATPAEETDHA